MAESNDRNDSIDLGSNQPENENRCDSEKLKDRDRVVLEPLYEAAMSSDFKNRYKVLERIGSGGSGTIFLAEHLILKRKLVLKVLNRILTQDPVSISRFSREASACAALTHPNLVQIYDCGLTSDGVPFLVMEYVSGKSLEALIKESKNVDISTFFSIFIPLCAALQFVHENSVVHRDLKPDNIIVSDEYSGNKIVKIIDFGIAKVEEMGGQLQLLTHTGELLGTPNYMSPEQCRGLDVDGRSDIYALGCVMYEALSGKVAFRGHSAASVIYQQLEESPKQLAELDGLDRQAKTLSMTVMKCLAKDPEDRYQSMKELGEDLELLRKKLGVKPIRESGAIKSAGKISIAATILIALFSSAIFVACFFFFESDGYLLSKGKKVSAELAYANLLDRLGLKEGSLKLLESMAIRSGYITDPETRVSVSLMVMKQFNDTGKWQSIKQYFKSIEKDLNVLHKTDSSEGNLAPLAYLYYATACQQTGEEEQANHNGLKAIELAQKLNSPDWLKAQLELSYGKYLFHKTQPLEALDHFMRSATFYEELPNTSELKTKGLVDVYTWIMWSCQAAKNRGLQDHRDWIAEGEKYLLKAVNLAIAVQDYDEAARLGLLLSKHLGNYGRWQELASLRRQLSGHEELFSAAISAGVFSTPRMVQRPSPLYLVSLVTDLKSYSKKELSSRLEAALKLAEDLGASDIDKLSIAEKLLEYYNDRWDDDGVTKILRRVAPSLRRVEDSYKKSGELFLTGAAPLIYLRAAELKFHNNDFYGAIEDCDRGIALAVGQPSESIFLIPLEKCKGLSFKKLNRFADAQRFLSSSLGKAKAYYGTGDIEAIDTMISLSEVLLLDNKLRNADDLSRQAIQELNKTKLAKYFSKAKGLRDNLIMRQKSLLMNGE